MKRKWMATTAMITATAGVLAVMGCWAIAAQDKYTVKVQNGLSFADFRGYEDWRNVAVSQVKDGIKIIAANPAMISRATSLRVVICREVSAFTGPPPGYRWLG